MVLTGRGGDEWLTVTPYLMADLAPRGDVGGHLAHVADVAPIPRLDSGVEAMRAAALEHRRTAAGERGARRGRARGRGTRGDVGACFVSGRHGWRPTRRSARRWTRRIERWIDPARPPQGFYVREMRTALFHPGITHDMEETQEFGRRNGQRMLHPFWDVDLVNALYRVPPDLLMRDGRSKWLLRRRLEARLPGLGLERRTKVSAGGVFTGMMAREARPAWDRLGGLQTLSEAGVVSEPGCGVSELIPR